LTNEIFYVHVFFKSFWLAKMFEKCHKRVYSAVVPGNSDSTTLL